jgi:uncharacterized protein YdeI (YjbR/CyaY-like superfamily)
MPVNEALGQAVGAKPGDVVEMVMERDEEPRSVDAPPERMKELAKSKSGQTRWDELAFPQQKEIANSMLSAKQEETRDRKLAKVMRVLKTEAKGTG